MFDNFHKYKTYAEDILSGNILACQYIKLAASRYLSWFDRDDIEFCPDKADKVVNFIEKLKLFLGKWAGLPLKLQEWQKFFIYGIFGWYYKGTNKRVVRHATIEVPRKNGKSTLVAGIALYKLVAEGEAGAEIDIVANTRLLAKILFDMASSISKRMDPRHKHLYLTINRVKYPKKDSYILVLASESASLDGYGSSLYIIDEIHNLADSKLNDVLASSQAARENPLSIYITTAGYLLSGFYYKDIRPSLLSILNNTLENDSTFALIYTLDDEDDITDKKSWYKANPNLGVSVFEDYLQDRIDNIKTNPSSLVDVKTKQFNIWCSSSEVWLQDSLITKNSLVINIDNFKNEQKLYACAGIDLSSVSDFTVFSICFNHKDKFYFKTWYFLPETALIESPNAELYKLCKRLGYIEITPGNVTDYDYILKKILEINKIIKIFKIGYDTWNSSLFTINATLNKLPMFPYSQTLGSFNRPCKEFERLIKSDKVIIDTNPLTNFCFLNAILKTDWNGNAKPVKGGGKSQKIDATISMLESLGIMIESKPFKHFFEVI